MKIIILLLTLVRVCQQQHLIRVLCYENCDSYRNPLKPIVLFAACSGPDCVAVKFKWYLISNPKYTKQSFDDNDITGASENKFTIKANVLSRGEIYEIKLEAKSATGDAVHHRLIKLYMEKCSTKFPCEEISSTISPDYVGDTSFDNNLALLPPEELKTTAKNNLKILQSLDKMSPVYTQKRKELLLTIKHLPLSNEAEIKACSELIRTVVGEAGGKPFEPESAKLVAQIDGELAKARLALVKKSEKPNALGEDVQRMSKEIFGHSKVTVNVSKDQLTEHREIKQEAEQNIIFQAPFQETYPTYDDFDVQYQGKHINIESVADETVQIIENLGEANLLTMTERTNEQQIVTNDICMLNILDAPNNIKDKTYLCCDVTYFVSSNLAIELGRNMRTSAISFGVVKKNLFWWNTPKGTAFLVYIDIENFDTKRKVLHLQNPIQFKTKADHKETQVVKGTFKVPVNQNMNDIHDEDISVFQLMPDKEIQVVMIHFEKLKDGDEIKVIMLKNQRPQLEDFSNSFTIPKSENEENRNIIIHRIHIPVGSFGYVGVLPTAKTMKNSGSNINDYRYFHYSVKFTRLSCDTWNGYKLNWEGNHCQVSRKTSFQEIECSCYHTTVFAAISSNIESRPIEDWEIPIFLTREYNFVVLITVILVLFLFAVVLLFVIWRQRKYQRQKRVLFLLDNDLNGDCEYLICVYTGTQKLSGTTANIGIKIYGSAANTDRHVLRGHYEPVLQRGHEDWFYLMTPSDLGKLEKIDLWTDCNGFRVSWFCKKIVIHGLRHKQKWIFEVNQWFSVLNDNVCNTTSGTLKESNIPKSKWNYAKCAIKEHLWMTPFRNLGTTSFSYFERMLLILCIVLVNMLFAMVFLGVPYPSLYGQFGRGHFCFEAVEFGLALAVALISFGISCGFIYLFENLKPISERNRKYFMKMIPFDSSLIKIFLYTIIVISLGILIPFGLWFNYVSSLVWLPIFVVATMLCILFEMIRVTVTAALLKETRKTFTTNAKLDMSDIGKQKELLFKQYGEKGLRPFFHKYYHPISETEIKMKKEKEIQRIELRTIVVDIIMFTIYLIILFCVVLLNKDSMSTKFTQTIENIFIEDKFIRELKFDEINSEKRLYRYLRVVLFPAVSTRGWYPGYTSSEPGLLADFSSQLLGVARVRQQRHGDTAQYRPRWEPWGGGAQPAHPPASALLWCWQSGTQSHTNAVIGELSTYPAGGYIANFGRNLENSLLVLQYMESLKWIDERTSALFFEVYFYNANQNLFSLLTLIVEISPTGKYITNYQLRTSRFLFLYNELAIRTFITFLLLIIMIFIFSWRTYKEFKNSIVSQFLANFWNIIDIFIILISFVFILVYFLRSVAVGSLIKSLEESAHNEFVSFNNALYMDDCVILLATILVTISTVRLWKILRFLRMFRICEVTLILAAKYLLAVAFITVIVLFAYSTFGYIVFGSYSANFRTVPQSFVSLLIHSFGFKTDIKFEVFESTYCYIGYIYYVIFMIILIFLINIFIAIIVFAYESAKDYFDESDKEKLVNYNMFNYLNDEYKYYTSKHKGRNISYHLRGGEEIIDIENVTDIEPRTDVARKQVRINPDRAKSMHVISDQVLNILLEKYARNHNLSIPECDDLISEIFSNIFNETLEAKPNIEHDELYVVIPEDYTYRYISKQRLLDMYCIVEYLLKSKESETQSTLDKQVAMIISMNLVVKEMIQQLENITSEMFVNTGTNVTFSDLGLTLVELEEDDDNGRGRDCKFCKTEMS